MTLATLVLGAMLLVGAETANANAELADLDDDVLWFMALRHRVGSCDLYVESRFYRGDAQYGTYCCTGDLLVDGEVAYSVPVVGVQTSCWRYHCSFTDSSDHRVSHLRSHILPKLRSFLRAGMCDQGS